MNRRPTMTLLVNPRAGHSRAARELPGVAAELVRGLPDHLLRVVRTRDFTDAKVQALAAVRASLEAGEAARPDMLLVMGGDGMASIGLNACAGTPVRLGVIPAGTGNDFTRGMGVPTTGPGAVAAIVSGAERRVDLMLVEGSLTGGAARRHVGSVVSTGYDARVNYRTNHRRFSLGSLSYGLDAIAELARFEPLRYRLTVDGVTREEPAMLIAVANAGVFGGGMRICPYADPSDGLLDVTIIHPVSRLTLIRLLRTMYDGSFVRDPCVELLRARRVHIAGDDMFGMADGEELGDVPLELGVERGALHLLGADAMEPLGPPRKAIQGPPPEADDTDDEDDGSA